LQRSASFARPAGPPVFFSSSKSLLLFPLEEGRLWRQSSGRSYCFFNFLFDLNCLSDVRLIEAVDADMNLRRPYVSTKIPGRECRRGRVIRTTGWPCALCARVAAIVRHPGPCLGLRRQAQMTKRLSWPSGAGLARRSESTGIMLLPIFPVDSAIVLLFKPRAEVGDSGESIM